VRTRRFQPFLFLFRFPAAPCRHLRVGFLVSVIIVIIIIIILDARMYAQCGPREMLLLQLLRGQADPLYFII
jgi:hypothetical protein